MTTPPDRVEADLLGKKPVPADAYWGVHTARAVENFPISGIPLMAHPDLISALAAVKQAAARANRDLGLLESSTAEAIDQACGELREGRWADHLIVDVVQGGAGTSTNMNVNEVVANRALELLGYPRGRYDVIDPLDHVNRSQSTNDVYPTAVKIALRQALDRLADTVQRVVNALETKAAEFATVPKMGRTQLQDAVPMTVGQEFGAWAATLSEEEARFADLRRLLGEITLGATAIGTGLNAAPTYAISVCTHLRAITGLDLVTADNLIEATSDTGVFVHVSSALKRTAIKVSKVCNDLRLLSSGPQTGFGELSLPPRQAGSSIMPGKVNPVIPEVVNQVAFAVVGGDLTVTMAADGGQLQLNAFEPIIAHTLLTNITWMVNAFDVLARHCIAGIGVNAQHLLDTTARNVGVVTALTPHIGHAAAAHVVRSALAGEGTVRDIVVGRGLLTADRADEMLCLERITGLLPAGSTAQSGSASES